MCERNKLFVHRHFSEAGKGDPNPEDKLRMYYII